MTWNTIQDYLKDPDGFKKHQEEFKQGLVCPECLVKRKSGICPICGKPRILENERDDGRIAD